jgi:peptidoglycan/xylan/chitin deacetylase (PgdA/CDA1 family)
VLTHDVEGTNGLRDFKNLVAIEQRLGFKSAFYFVPKKYKVDQATLDFLRDRSFEVGVHGWKHDGRLYSSRSKFEQRSRKINQRLKDWNAVGFRSPAMHHNLEWLRLLDIEYDLSTFDTDPFEPQPDGVTTIFPFWVGNQMSEKGYVEMPYTLSQDFTLFILMEQRDIDTWVRKLRWIADIGGMALLCTHPDYMNFDGRNHQRHRYPATLYEDFLRHVEDHFSGQYWNALPCEMSRFWKTRLSSRCAGGMGS